jgi:hypothetical protein
VSHTRSTSCRSSSYAPCTSPIKIVRVIYYFLGNHGINTLVFALYVSQFILPAYLASWSGIPETNNNKIVILIHDMKPIYENGKEIKLIPSQKILSPK